MNFDQHKVPWQQELWANLRGLGLLFRAAPLTALVLLALTILQGFLPAIVIAQVGRFLTALTATGQGTPDGASAPGALSIGAGQTPLQILAVLIGAIMLTQVLSPAQEGVHFGFQRRFQAYLSRRLMASVGSLPGLAYHEDATFRDKLEVSQWVGWAPVHSLHHIRNAFQNIATIGSMAVITAQFAPWAPALIILTAVPEGILQWRAVGQEGWAKLHFTPDARRSAYYKRLGLILEPAKELRIFGLRTWVLDRQADHWLNSILHAWRVRRRNMLIRLGLHLIAIGGMAFAFIRLVHATLAGTVDIGLFTAASMAIVGLMSQLIATFGTAAQLRQSNFYLPTAFKLLDLYDTDPRLEVGGTQPAHGLAPTGIRFEDVSFTYPGTDREILSHLDLEIPAGGSVALVGENGAGKTTLIKLLCRFYDPSAGRITLDGVDVRAFDLADLRRRLAVIFQDFVRFHLPARDNVGFGAVEHHADEALYTEAARRIGILEKIESLPDGWDTPLHRDFGGMDLSGGEWQRVALARAVMAQLGSDADLLILDEPTASLDVRHEHELYEQFAELSRGRTTLLVSHRFSTVRMADRIILVEGGRVVEDGSHDQLIAGAGRYAELYELQASHYRMTGSLE